MTQMYAPQGHYQQGNMQSPQPAPVVPLQVAAPNMVPPDCQSYLGLMSQGTMPYENYIRVVGQIYDSPQMPQGFLWRPTEQGGMLMIRIKLSRQRPNKAPVIAYTTVIAWGQQGQALMSTLALGQIVRVTGEWQENTFKDKRGQWRSNSQIVLSRSVDGSPNFVIMGTMPIVREQNVASQPRGHQAPYNQQPQYPASQGYPPQPPQQQYNQPPQPPQGYQQPQAPAYPPPQQQQQYAQPPQAQPQGGYITPPPAAPYPGQTPLPIPPANRGSAPLPYNINPQHPGPSNNPNCPI